MVMRSIPGSDPVHQITIIPRGSAGGFTMWLPTEDRSFETKKDMEHQIMHLLGGRVSEALTLDDISTGASNDIERATDIARSMVTKYGFSEKIGPVNYSDSDDVFLGRDFSKTKAYSDSVASEIDHEVRDILERAYQETERILKEHMDQVVSVAEALMRVETLDGEQFEELYTGKIDAEGIEKQVREHEDKIRRENEKEAAESRQIRKEEEEARRAAASEDENGQGPRVIRLTIDDQNGGLAIEDSAHPGKKEPAEGAGRPEAEETPAEETRGENPLPESPDAPETRDGKTDKADNADGE